MASAACVACQDHEVAGGIPGSAAEPAEPAAPQPAPLAPSLPVHQDELAEQRHAFAEETERCLGPLAEAYQSAELPGTPRLDRYREQLLGRTKAEPVIFWRAPEYEPTDDRVVRSYRAVLERSTFPWTLVKTLTERFATIKHTARAVFLREGYLYADKPVMAPPLSEFVTLETLFDEPTVWIERGARRLQARRNDAGRYVYSSGPDEGERARLLLFDRVGVSESERHPPLHLDVRSLAYRIGSEELRVRRLTQRYVVVDARYGEHWIPTVLERDGAQLTRECEVVEADQVESLLATRARLRARHNALAGLRFAILQQVTERLPFDEPETEWGQQDGQLKLAWERAYFDGEDTYTFNFDRYDVFTETGAPRVPQVCIDFITHSFERASGTWWAAKGEERRRVVGKLDLNQVMRHNRRQVYGFLDFIRDHEQHFDMMTLPIADRVPYKLKWRFFDYLKARKRDYQSGDIIIIRGYAPWDHYAVPHSHTFFVYETDPMTGMPLLLAGNAGKPRIRAWEPVMGRTPLRSIRHRIRPKTEWLEQIVDVTPEILERMAPAPLVAYPH